MSKIDYTIFLKDILTSAGKILRWVNDKSYEESTRDEILIDAVIRNLEIIGEAVKNLPAKVRRKYSDFEWRKIAGLRDILIHKYSAIDHEILWDIITNKVPELRNRIWLILEEEKEGYIDI